MEYHDDSIIFDCHNCGASNRIPSARIYDDPKCGKCKLPLFPRKPIAVTDDTFNDEVEKSPIPVLVDFWAPWCGPCRFIAPVLEKVAEERASHLKIVKVNVDDNQTIAGRFSIRSIPTLMLFKQSQPIAEMVGALQKNEIDARLDYFLKPN